MVMGIGMLLSYLLMYMFNDADGCIAAICSQF